MEHIASNYDDFVIAIIYCGSLTTGNFGLRIGKIGALYFTKIDVKKEMLEVTIKDKKNRLQKM